MRICWYDDNRLGVVRGTQVFDVTEVLDRLPSPVYPPTEKGDLLIANLERLRPALELAADQAGGRDLRDIRLLSPVAQPTKIIGTPVNYLAHAEEAKSQTEVFTGRYIGGIEQQGLFLKATSSLVGAGEGVALRFPDRRTDHEIELGVVIGRTAANVGEADALSYVAGYAIALDMVVRGPEDRSFRKSPDSYAVLGPWLVTADELGDPGDLAFSLRVGNEVRQASNTAKMIMGVARQIAWASSCYTLHPGDIIMTGTCEGVSQVHPGDVMSCDFARIGAMEVKVR